jgi:hypothetical protein
LRRVKKIALMSVLIATFWIPMWYAGKSNPKRTLPKMQKSFVIFCVIYVLTVVYVLPYL